MAFTRVGSSCKNNTRINITHLFDFTTSGHGCKPQDRRKNVRKCEAATYGACVWYIDVLNKQILACPIHWKECGADRKRARNIDTDAMLGNPVTTHISVPKLNGKFAFPMSNWISKQGLAYHIPTPIDP